MSAWIESHQTLRDHPKKDHLAELLFAGTVTDDVADFAAIGLLHELWWWALDYAQDGDLSPFTDRQVSRGCRWTGDPAVLMDGLVTAGFVTGDRQIHDWFDYAGKLMERRERNRDRMREARSAASKSTCKARATHSTRTCSATEPNPTVPNPTIIPVVPKEPAPPPVKAPDWQEKSDFYLSESRFPSDLMQLGELLACENKTGKVALSRVVSELYEPLVAMQAEFTDEAMRHGLRAAITAMAPNANYVRKAAAKYRPLAAAAQPARTTEYDDLLEEE